MNKLAMTLEEAKETLGFGAYSRPSAGDIKSAWKTQAFKAHPDKGGDLEHMKQVNLAQDILLGKARATNGPRPAPSSKPSGTPAGADPGWGAGFEPKPHEEKRVSFNDAMSKGGVPSGVDWQFVTTMQRSKSGWRGDSSGKSTRGFVAYGTKGDKHIFVGAKNYESYSNFVGGGYTHDIWTVEGFPVSGSEKDATNPAWLYRNVVNVMKKMDMGVKFNSKVLETPNWKLNDRLPVGKGVSIKHWLVNTGKLDEADDAVVNRKQVVELEYFKNYGGTGPGFHEVPAVFGGGSDWVKYVLTVNGKAVTLDKQDTLRLEKSRNFKRTVFKDDLPHSGAKKVLTRLRSGKKVLAFLADQLKSVPPREKKALEAAAAQMKG